MAARNASFSRPQMIQIQIRARRAAEIAAPKHDFRPLVAEPDRLGDAAHHQRDAVGIGYSRVVGDLKFLGHAFYTIHAAGHNCRLIIQ